MSLLPNKRFSTGSLLQKGRIRVFFVLTFIIFLTFLSSCSHKHIPLTITRVSTDKVSFDPAKQEKVDISYSISKAAQVWVNIYDARNRLVKCVLCNVRQTGGAHSVSWDGRNAQGIVVPDEAYVYTIAAKKGKDYVVWDLADLTGGQTVRPVFFKTDKKKGEIEYGLNKPARVRINAGLLIKNGAGILMRNLVDWVAQPAGSYMVRFDGWDARHQLHFIKDKNFAAGFEGYYLPDNTIIVTGTNSLSAQAYFRSTWENEQPLRPAIKVTRTRQMHASMDRLYDFSPKMYLQFPSHVVNSRGIPMINQHTPIKIGISSQDAPYIKGRIETHIFIDNKLVYQDFSGYMPFTYEIPSWVKPGKHTIIVFLCIWKDNYATIAQNVYVKRGTL